MCSLCTGGRSIHTHDPQAPNPSLNTLLPCPVLPACRRIAALLEQLQRTALTDSLTQLSPTAGDAVSLSALNALVASGQLSPSYAAGLAAGDTLAAEFQRSANLAASLLQNQGSSLAGMLAEQQQQQQAGSTQQQQQQQMYQQGGDNAAAAAVLLQSHLSSEATQLGNLPGSAPVSAAPTPTAAAAAMAPTVFQQQRGPSPATSGLEVPVSAAAAMPAQQPPKSQPLMAVYHPLLQQKAGAGLRADILVDARSNNSPTIPASWGGVAPGTGAPGTDMGLQQQQSALAAQLKQHAAAGLPPPPPPVQVSAPAAVEHPAGVPMELPNVSLPASQQRTCILPAPLVGRCCLSLWLCPFPWQLPSV